VIVVPTARRRPAGERRVTPAQGAAVVEPGRATGRLSATRVSHPGRFGATRTARTRRPGIDDPQAPQGTLAAG
jgi:hypothetical protein